MVKVESLKLAIKQMVRKEVKALLSEVDFGELIETEVNRVLAERFLSSAGRQTVVMSESEEVPRNVSATNAQVMAAAQNKRQKAANDVKSRAERIKQLTGEDPMMAHIYGDIVSAPNQAVPLRESNGYVAPITQPTQTADGRVVDSDDEGVPLEQFGLL